MKYIGRAEMRQRTGYPAVKRTRVIVVPALHFTSADPTALEATKAVLQRVDSL